MFIYIGLDSTPHNQISVTNQTAATTCCLSNPLLQVSLSHQEPYLLPIVSCPLLFLWLHFIIFLALLGFTCHVVFIGFLDHLFSSTFVRCQNHCNLFFPVLLFIMPTFFVQSMNICIILSKISCSV